MSDISFKVYMKAQEVKSFHFSIEAISLCIENSK